MRRLGTRRRLTVIVLALAFVGSVTSFALGDTSTVAPSITPPPGVQANGAVAAVDTSIATGITRSNGAAQLDSGVVLGAIEVAPSYADKLNVSIYWTDPYDATKALNSPHAQISIGLYYPVESGACHSSDPSQTNAYVEVLYDSVEYCSVLDSSATGSANVFSGKMLLSRRGPFGYLFPDVPDNASLPTCPASTAETASYEVVSNWCQPSTVTTDGVVFVCASILTPGGIPPGSQATLNSLRFFIDALRH